MGDAMPPASPTRPDSSFIGFSFSFSYFDRTHSVPLRGYSSSLHSVLPASGPRWNPFVRLHLHLEQRGLFIIWWKAFPSSHWPWLPVALDSGCPEFQSSWTWGLGTPSSPDSPRLLLAAWTWNRYAWSSTPGGEDQKKGSAAGEGEEGRSKVPHPRSLALRGSLPWCPGLCVVLFHGFHTHLTTCLLKTSFPL